MGNPKGENEQPKAVRGAAARPPPREGGKPGAAAAGGGAREEERRLQADPSRKLTVRGQSELSP